MMMIHRRAPEFYVFGDCLSHCFKQNNDRASFISLHSHSILIDTYWAVNALEDTWSYQFNKWSQIRREATK
jgi:hypothetical protein